MRSCRVALEGVVGEGVGAVGINCTTCFGLVALKGVALNSVGVIGINRTTNTTSCAVGSIALKRVVGYGIIVLGKNCAARCICSSGDVGSESIGADGVGTGVITSINCATICIACAAGDVAAEGVGCDCVGVVIEVDCAAISSCSAGNVGVEGVARDDVGGGGKINSTTDSCCVAGKGVGNYGVVGITCINGTTFRSGNVTSESIGADGVGSATKVDCTAFIGCIRIECVAFNRIRVAGINCTTSIA